MAFEALSDRLQGIFKKISGQGKLTEANMDEMLKEIRKALSIKLKPYKNYSMHQLMADIDIFINYL